MRRLILFAIIFFLVAAPLLSFAEMAVEDATDLLYDSPFISLGDYGYPIDLFLRLIGFCDISYTADEDGPEPRMDQPAVDALKDYQLTNGLEPSGEFDPETVAKLLCVVDCDLDHLVWIPMHGGAKYHSGQKCSSMIEPCQLPIDCAIELKFDGCSKCKPGEPSRR